jgi:Tfp pilus assembly PilM family ATPase
MTSLVLGIGITGRYVHAVEISRAGLASTLNAIDEWENPFTSGFDIPPPQAFEMFAEYLSAFMKVNQVKARHVSIALDTASLFIQRIPIEETSTDDMIREQIRWEITQYFPGTDPAEFISDYHRMSRFPSVRLNEILSVSIRRKLAQSLEKALGSLDLRLLILDADHFSAETALRANYPDSLRRNIALIGIKSDRLDHTLLKNGNLESYSAVELESPEDIVEEFARITREHADVFSSVAYGPALNSELLHEIRLGSSSLVEALNPLRQVTVSETLRVAEHITSPSYRFAGAIGVALRRN